MPFAAGVREDGVQFIGEGKFRGGEVLHGSFESPEFESAVACESDPVVYGFVRPIVELADARLVGIVEHDFVNDVIIVGMGLDVAVGDGEGAADFIDAGDGEDVFEGAVIARVEVEEVARLEREGFEIEFSGGLREKIMFEAVFWKRTRDDIGIGVGTHEPEIVRIGVAAEEARVAQLGNGKRPAHVGGVGVLDEADFFGFRQRIFLRG